MARTLGPFLPPHRFVVVGYHRVVDRFEWEAPRTLPASLVSQRMLERHLDWIGRDHEFVTLDELGYRLQVGERIDRPMAAVTFDDGYRDVYEHAFPMLMRKGIPAALFVVTDLIGTLKPQTHDRLHALLRVALRRWLRPAETIRRRFELLEIAEGRRMSLPDSTDPYVWTRLLLTSLSARHLDRLLADLEEKLGEPPQIAAGAMPLSWDMVVEMHRAGVTIGSHTSSHVMLTAESRPRVSAEVSESRRQLEQRIGHRVVHFAYPDGRFNRTAVNAVRLAGYQFGYTTCEHRDNRQPLLTIPRRVLWEHSAVDMNGRFEPEILRCQERGWLVGRRTCNWQSHA